MPTRRQLQIIEAAARKYGIDPAVEYGVWGTETGFSGTGSRSEAGAEGPFQFTPGTAKGRHINPLDFKESAFEAAHYLSEFKGRGLAGMLGAYNAGPSGNIHNPQTLAYIPKVQSLAKQWARAAKGLGGEPRLEAMAASGDLPSGIDQQPSRLYGTLASLEGSSTNPYSARGQSNYRFLEALTRNTEDQVSTARAAMRAHENESNVLGTPKTASTRGQVIFSPGADRPGVPTQRVVREYISLIAGSIGKPINVGTGSNHSRYTVEGNISDHSTGHAADLPVPVDSTQGDMIAGRALTLAGIPQLQARSMAQRGGLYTITPKSGPMKGHRVQVIWKTDEGGNHHSHVHVGVQ